MTIIQQQMLVTIIQQQRIVPVDTDTFTREEWVAFIKQHVPAKVILAAPSTELFSWDYLKHRAILSAQFSAEFKL